MSRFITTGELDQVRLELTQWLRSEWPEVFESKQFSKVRKEVHKMKNDIELLQIGQRRSDAEIKLYFQILKDRKSFWSRVLTTIKAKLKGKPKKRKYIKRKK